MTIAAAQFQSWLPFRLPSATHPAAVVCCRLVFSGGTRLIGNVWRSVNDHQYIGIARNASECARSGVRNCFANTRSEAQFECAVQMFERHVGAPAPRAWAVYANAQFGVTRDRITERPLRCE